MNSMLNSTTSTMILALMCWVLPHRVPADKSPQPPRVTSSAEYQQMLKRINTVRTSNDASIINILAQEIQNKWSTTNIVQYSTLVDRLCYTILLSDLGKRDEGSYIVSKYALLALARQEEMPLLIEADLVNDLQPQERKTLLTNTMPVKNWVEYRSARAAISLHLLGRISKETDPNFDFNRVPMLNVLPPAGANFPAGTSPNDVADPKLRAEYEASIRANEAFNSKRNEQLQLKELNETLVPLQQKYVVDLYSAAPYNLSELRSLLNKYTLAETAKQKMLERVTANMALANHS